MRRISGNTTGSESEEIRIRPDPGLLATLDDTAGLMGLSREELVLVILRYWMKRSAIPRNGKGTLCSLEPDGFDRE